MNTEADGLAPSPAAQRAILGFAIVAGALLLIAHEAVDAEAAWFAGGLIRTVWYTLAVLPALMAVLTVQSLDRRFAAALVAYTALLAYLAVYAGRAIAPTGVESGAVLLTYACVLIGSGHVAAAWLSCHFARAGFGYPRLFEAAWAHTTTLIQVNVYLSGFWLLLFLWAALFKALQVDFFAELFGEPRFIYPATSLMLGFGMVIARTKSGIGDAVHLRILALWRGLLPLAAALAIAFTLGVLVQGVQALWDTRRATFLLLSLIVALVVLANAAYGKGGESAPHPVTRWLTRIALLLLPLFAALAAVALALRWQQYGVSLDRLWAALSLVIASIYALGYALAAFRGGTPWLAGIAPVNRFASLFAAGLLVLTQTGLMDFRAITAHALRGQSASLSDEDLRYLRWELGSPGLTALQAIRSDLAASDPVRAEALGQLLAAKQRYAAPAEDTTPASTQPIQHRQPEGSAPPPAPLLAVLNRLVPEDDARDALADARREHWLYALELEGGPPLEWLRVSFTADETQRALRLEVFQQRGEDWVRARSTREWIGNKAAFDRTVAALHSGQLEAVVPAWRELRIDGQRLKLDDE